MSLAEHIQPVLSKFPAALVAAFLLQTAGALFWAGSAAERIAVLERTHENERAAIEHVAVLEAQASEMRAQLARIESKLDRMAVAAAQSTPAHPNP
jgi:hypothetical protein